jgi:hypothetical protein
MYGIHFKILEIVSKETLCQRGEPEGECEASDKDVWKINMPDGDEIDDVEEVSVDDDSPPPRNRQRLGC